MRVAVLGQGYVGITASVCLAEVGHEVVGVENDLERLDSLRRGEPGLYEPGVADGLRAQMRAQRLTFCDSLRDARGPLDAVVIAVGSPPLPSGGADLRQVADAVADVAAMEPPPRLVVMKSTVPPGTSERFFAETSPAFHLCDRYAVSPEFLSLGTALRDWRSPNRVVVGLHQESLLPRLRDLYRGIEAPWIVTTPTSAEMIKYASNAFLATKISFVNEIVNLCDEVGGSIDDVVTGMGLDPRIGVAHMRAGVGYGGSCFPKDTRALAHLSNLKGHSMPLLEAVTAVNNAQRLRVVRLVRQGLGESGAVVAVLGLSFKPGTDDLRDAPSLTVVSELVALGYEVRVWDPVVSVDAVRDVFPGVRGADRLDAAVTGADAVVVLTEWPEVVGARWEVLVPRMGDRRLVIDGRNCLDPAQLQASGAAYHGIGRPAVGSAGSVAAPVAQRRRIASPRAALLAD